MSYYRVLLVRWSRRDVLAVVALAAIVAFLTGSALFYVAAEDKPTALASEYQPAGTVTEYDSPAQARQASEESDVVLRFTTVGGADGDAESTVVGIGPDDRATAQQLDLALPEPPERDLGQPATDGTGTLPIEHSGETRSFTVTGVADNGILPDGWYVAQPSVVDTIGPTGALLVSGVSEPQADSPGVSDGAGTVLRGTLLFFERGTQQVLTGFALLVVGAGVLGGVTVTSVVRMTVRDRIETIEVVRSTGATPTRVLSLFALRGLLLTAVAVAAGYAIGVVVSSLATSLAVFAGLPTTISPRVTGEAARLLVATYVPVLVVGCIAGAIAALPAVRRPLAALSDGTDRRGRFDLRRRVTARVPAVFQIQLLDWRAVVPTTATIAVFATIVFLVLSGGGVATTLAGNSSATVLESGAIHPLASTVPASHADVLQAGGVAASPEILVFGVIDDRPTIVRGGQYDAFAAVSNATLTDGRRSQATNEAMIGQDLARTHGLDVGDTVVVGSGLQDTVTRVRIVGAYEAPSAYDDQLLVSLPTGRHLSAKRDGDVSFIRLDRRPVAASQSRGVNVLDVTVHQPAVTPTVTVNVSVLNLGDESRTRDISAALGNATVTEPVTLDPRSRRGVRMDVPVSTPGTYRLTVENQSRNVTVRAPNELVIEGLPVTVPPRSEPTVRVETVAGQPAANATVTAGNETRTVAPDGRVRLPFDGVGETVVRATAGNRTTTQRVQVSANATRMLPAVVNVAPTEVDERTAPTATVRLSNPWNRTAVRNLTLGGPGGQTRWTVTVEPGGTVTRTATLAQRPEGEYAVVASVNDSAVAETSYRVGGDRLSTVALRNTDVTSGGSLGIAITTVFGNLQLIVGALVALAGVMVAGALVASFARTIHAHRRTIGIHRATGATPRRVLALVVRDGLLVGTVGVVLGLGLGAGVFSALAAGDLLVFFGIRIDPSFTLRQVLAVGGAAVGLVLVGVLVPAIALVRRPPAAQFIDDTGAGHRTPASDRRHVVSDRQSGSGGEHVERGGP